MKSLKERMLKIDKICQKLNIPDQNKGLFKRKKNNSCILKEQDKNINNVSMISSNAGCIISRTQLKKQQSIQILQCDTVRSQTLSLKQLKMIHEQDQIQCMQSQKEELQNQINSLVQMKKQIQEQEEKKKKQFITQDTSLLPQMLKLQQEKLSIENEITQIDSRIEQVRYSNINKLQVLQKRNWKEEKKSFEQKWLDLEQNESKIQIDDKLYTLFIHDSPPQEQVDQKTIDTLTKEVEDLLCLKLPDDKVKEANSISIINLHYKQLKKSNPSNCLFKNYEYNLLIQLQMSINKNLDDDKVIEIDENILSNSDGTLNVIEEYHQQNEAIEEVAYNNYIHFAIYLFYYSIIQIFLKQQSTIMIILIIHALLSTISLIVNIINSNNIINKLKIVLHFNIEISLFWFVTFLNITCNFAIYYFSYQAFNLKQYRLYEHLSKLIFFSFFIQQIQQFDYQINVMLIFIKILTQFYVKNTAHLIKNIISLPQFNSI